MEPSKRNAELPVLLIYDLDRKNWGSFEIHNVLNKIEQLLKGLTEMGYPLTILQINENNLEGRLKPYSPENFVLFNLCEEIPGIPHSAGLVGETIEKMGFTHTGPSPRILSLSQDKTNVKKLADQFNIPTPQWHTYSSIHKNGWNHFPAIVKPSLEHCSIGIDSMAVVKNLDELTNRIGYVIQNHHQPALVEDFIDGREFRISVIGNDDHIHMLPPVEIDYSYFNQVSDRVLTYDSKMNPQSVSYQEVKLNANPVLDSDQYRLLESLAFKTFQMLECHDYAGFDFRLRDGIFYLLDANPDPEFSPETSMVIGAAREGFSFASLASFIIREAAKRHPVLQLLG